MELRAYSRTAVMKTKSLYIIRRDSGVCLFHKDFTASVYDPDLISSFMVAMTSFFDEATSSLESRARTFEGTDHKILIEFGEWTLGALSATEDNAYLRKKLKHIVDRFEEQFNLLRWVDMDLALHTRFDRVVIEEFIREHIFEDSEIRVKMNWDLITTEPEIVAFLRVIPEKCTVGQAAQFLEVPLEVALNMTANAVWVRAISVSNPIKPDDIYQVTSPTGTRGMVDGVSPETVKALPALDGETTLAIVAEKVKTSDLQRFLKEIDILAKKHQVELISRAQEALVLNSTALQSILSGAASLIGNRITSQIFEKSREGLIATFSWLVFIFLEKDIDVEVKSSLLTAAIKGKITPDLLNDGFRELLQLVINRVVVFLGPNPTKQLVSSSRLELEKIFPKVNYRIEWETF
ncbi:MAG: hypothetical protein ACTSV2_08695 [Candidatus Thorarchaeota archaeon]